MRQFPICLIFAFTLVLGAGGATAVPCGGLLPPCPPPAYDPPLNADGSLPVSSSLDPLSAPVAGEPLFAREAHVQVGFNDLARDTGQIFGNTANVAALAQAIGGTVVRSPIDWGQAQPSKTGAYAWKTWDDMYRGLVEHGVRPIFSIEGSPQWAADDLTACKNHLCTTGPQARYIDMYAAFVAAVAQRYPLAAAVEIWNEPNYHYFWKHPDPLAYTTLLKRSYAAVKQVRSAMRVLGGALQGGTVPKTNAVIGDDITLHDFLRATRRLPPDRRRRLAVPLHAQVDLLLFHTDVWVDSDKFGWTVINDTGYEPKPVFCDFAALIGAPPCEPIVAQR